MREPRLTGDSRFASCARCGSKKNEIASELVHTADATSSDEHDRSMQADERRDSLKRGRGKTPFSTPRVAVNKRARFPRHDFYVLCHNRVMTIRSPQYNKVLHFKMASSDSKRGAILHDHV